MYCSMLMLRLLNNKLAVARLTASCFLISSRSLAFASKYSLFYFSTSSMFLFNRVVSNSFFDCVTLSSVPSYLIVDGSVMFNFLEI